MVAAVAEAGRVATWVVIVTLLVASLCLVAGETGARSIWSRGKKDKKNRGKKRRPKGRAKRRGKKRSYGLIGCRHCHKRYTNPRGHVCRLSWKQMQKVRH